MRVSNVSVDGEGVTPEYQFDRTAARVLLPRPLPVAQSAVLSLKYVINVPTSLDSGYGLLSYTNDILALDTPYASIPVYNAEGWNVETPPTNADTSFNDASFYLVRVSAPANVKLVATGVDVVREAEGDRQVVTMAQGPARDFFVAASPDYTITTTQVGETRVNSYALPGEETAQANALQAAATAIQIFSQRFGPYPYSELDVAATPMLALGIEYPGTVGISERAYQAGFSPSSGTASAVVESTVAHELGHQWFYNLVGNDQVDEPWLDEAMAQYSTWLYFLDRYGPSAADAWQANWGSRWDRTDREKKSVGLPAREYTEREYGSIVYGRGPMFLTALAQRMGQVKFDRFLQAYTARFRWGIATAEDFKAMAQEACSCDLSDLYKEWLEP
jgi:aminopeptidase N